MASWPPPRELKRFHFECLQGMYFDHLRSNREGDLLLSDFVADPYYNFFAANDATSPGNIDEAAAALRSHDRKPAVYLGPQTKNHQEVADYLKERGYSRYGTDSWMGMDLPAEVDISLPATATLEYIDERGAVPYVAAFRAAYSGSTEDDPYGNLDEGYTQALQRSFAAPPPDGFERLFLQAIEGNAVVGVATLLTKGETAGCYGVGVVPTHRRRGIGRALMDQLAVTAAESGTKRIFLQTEAQSPVEQLYRSFGYQPLFMASYLVES